MRTRLTVGTLCVMLLVFCLPAHAQKIPRIGVLRGGAPLASGEPDEFLQALRSLGYVEGKNILIDIRYAEGNRDRLRDLATELVQSKADAIYTGEHTVIRDGLVFKLHSFMFLPEKVERWSGTVFGSLQQAPNAKHDV